MTGCIYKIANSVNGKAIFGKTTQSPKRRWVQHLCKLNKNNHNNQHLQAAWNLYGASNFSFEVVESGINLDKLNDREKFWIFTTNSHVSSHGYNMSLGGEGQLGWVPSKEWRLKKSILMTGSKRPPFSEEHRRKIAAAKVGKKMTSKNRVALDKYLVENREAVLLRLKKGRESVPYSVKKQVIKKAQGVLVDKYKNDHAFRAEKKRKAQELCAIPILDQNGRLYDSISDAAKIIGSTASNIRKQMRGSLSHNKGYIFREILKRAAGEDGNEGQ